MSHPCLSQVALPLRRLCGQCPDAARLHHQHAEMTWRQLGLALANAGCVDLSWTQTRTRRNLQHRRSHSGTLRMRSRRLTEPTRLTEKQSRPAGLFTTAGVQDAARLWTCVWPLPTLHRSEETLRKQPLIVNYHITDHKYLIFVVRHPLPVFSFGQPTGGRTLLSLTAVYATDIASSRNGQQMSAKSLQHRWKHEIQTALLRRRAAMTRAVFPKPSARAEWLFAGLIDRAVNHWARAHPLDGGDGDDDADTGRDTAIHDDDDDIASLASQQSHHCSTQASSCACSPPGAAGSP